MPLTQEQIETLTINRNSSEQTDQTQNIAYEVKSLEETINIMCIHAERLKRLYKCADEMNNECDSQKISDAIAHARANRVEPNVDLKKKKDKNLNSCINHALKYDEYRESIINKGGTSGTLFKDFFRVFKNTRKSHVKEMSNSLFMDDFKDDYSQAFESEPNPLKFLLKLQYALENKEDILPKIIERNQQIEMLKQERDKQILIRHYGVTDMANDSTVYADYFREGSKLGSSGHRMLSYTNKDGEIVTVGKSKNKVHEDYIKTRKEMEEKVKGADLKSFLKPNDIAEYIAFDPSSFVKSFASSDPGNTLQAAAASTPSTSAPSAQTPITVDTTEDSIGEHGFLYEKILGNLELVETGISAINGQFVTKELNSVFKNMDSENIISDKTISELTGNQTVKGFTKEDFQKSNLGDTYLSGSENVIYGKEYKKDGTSTDLTISKSDLKT
ncbi:MAG: hypothetical protein IJA12_00115, partial [Oscillospiraceae bacterium]|nr:hypothetical protein [Oscillospiraceae bacterium]